MRDLGILVVDDNGQYLNLMKTLFESAGIKVYCTQSGKEAIKKMRERRFSLMFTDFRMPGMDGLELAEKSREISPNLVMVMLTSDPSPYIPEMAVKVGISKVDTKPFTLEGVLAVIDDVKEPLIASLKEAIAVSAKEIVMIDKKEEQKQEEPLMKGVGKEDAHGITTWACPRCGTRYRGWSNLNRCSRCGYEE